MVHSVNVILSSESWKFWFLQPNTNKESVFWAWIRNLKFDRRGGKMSEFFNAFDKEYQIKPLDQTNPLNAKVISFSQSVFLWREGRR